MLFGRKVGEGGALSGETHRCSSLRSSLQNDLSQSLSVESPSMRTCALSSLTSPSTRARRGRGRCRRTSPRQGGRCRTGRRGRARPSPGARRPRRPRRRTGRPPRRHARGTEFSRPGVTRVSSPSRRWWRRSTPCSEVERRLSRYLPRGVRARERGHARLVLRRSAARPRSLSDVRRRTSNRCEEDGARRASHFSRIPAFRGERPRRQWTTRRQDAAPLRHARERETMPAATKVTDVFKKRGRAPAKGKAKAKATAVTGAQLARATTTIRENRPRGTLSPLPPSGAR